MQEPANLPEVSPRGCVCSKVKAAFNHGLFLMCVHFVPGGVVDEAVAVAAAAVYLAGHSAGLKKQQQQQELISAKHGTLCLLTNTHKAKKREEGKATHSCNSNMPEESGGRGLGHICQRERERERERGERVPNQVDSLKGRPLACLCLSAALSERVDDLIQVQGE